MDQRTGITPIYLDADGSVQAGRVYKSEACAIHAMALSGRTLIGMATVRFAQFEPVSEHAYWLARQRTSQSPSCTADGATSGG